MRYIAIEQDIQLQVIAKLHVHVRQPSESKQGTETDLIIVMSLVHVLNMESEY